MALRFPPQSKTLRAHEGHLLPFAGALPLLERFGHRLHPLRLLRCKVVQGRHQFAEGTPQRDVIDHIPTTPAQQAPAKAVIAVATSPAAGEAHLEFSATHATSYDVLHKGPGDADFAVVADDIIQTVYNATGLAAGAHEYKVLGRNSRGTGPESDVSVVNVV